MSETQALEGTSPAITLSSKHPLMCIGAFCTDNHLLRIVVQIPPTVGLMKAFSWGASLHRACHFLSCQICVRTRSSEPSCWTSNTNTTASWSLSSNTRPRCAGGRPVRGVVGKRGHLLAIWRNCNCCQILPFSPDYVGLSLFINCRTVVFRLGYSWNTLNDFGQ